MNQKGTYGKRWLTTLVLILLSLSLMTMVAACGRGGDEPTPEPAPTEAPTEAVATEPPPEPTAEPTAAEEPTAEPPAESAPASPLDSMEHTPDPMLIDVTWEWVQRDSNGNDVDDITVPNPENYLLRFDEEGMFVAKADCNNVGGAYATSNIDNDQKSIFMQAGPTTTAFCGEDSLDLYMLQMFGPAQNYYFEDDGDTLIFNWVAGGPIDTYRKASDTATEAEQPAEGVDPELANTLANMTYINEFTQDGTAPLVDGIYEEEAAPGSATKTTVTLLPEYTATGELNGVPAAAVILATDPGGSGTFIDLAVVTEQDGEPTNVATTSLGDRAQVESVAIENNQIVVTMVTHGPDDPMCCPTLQVVQIYELQGDQLVLVDTQEIGSTTDPDPVTEDSEAPPVEFPAAETDVPMGVVTAEFGVNVRTGPSTDYPIIGVAPQGAEGELIGKSEDGQWWVVAVPAGPDAQGWVAAPYVEAVNADDLPVIPAPPVPEASIEDALLSTGQAYEVEAGVIIYSASRVLQEGNRVTELEDIYVVPAAPDSTTELVGNNAMQPALSPDRQTLAFKSMQSDKLGIGGYDLDTATRLRYTNFNEDSNPRWSPTGDRIVYASDKQGDRAWRVYITEAVARENANDMVYQELGFGLDPDWHPSEELIVLKGCNDAGQECGLYTMSTDGSGRTPFTNVASDSRPRWFPDGSAVVFMSEERDGNWEIYRVNADRSEVTRLTDNAAPDGLPAVSPDGQQIAFFSKRGDSWGLWVMPASGGEASLITPIEGELPDWLLQSIDWPQ